MENAAELSSNGGYDALTSIEGRSSAATHVVELFQNRDAIDDDTLLHLAFVLMSLCFYDQASIVFRIAAARDPRHAAYAVINENLRSYGRTQDLGKEAIRLLKTVPRQKRFARARFNLLQMAVVYAGQRKHRDNLQFLCKISSGVLLDRLANANSDFAKHMLTSYFYRAVSYIPFVQGDRRELEGQAELIEQHGIVATPSSENEVIVHRENLFPMSETLARIYAALGQHDRASSLLERIPNEIDPYDLKGWMQLGDNYLKSSRLDDALRCYRRSVECAVPHGHIAWFKLGAAQEIAGDLSSAISSYRKSLYLEPTGYSTLIKLIDLAARTGDRVLLSELKSLMPADHISFPAAQREQLDSARKLLLDAI